MESRIRVLFLSILLSVGVMPVVYAAEEDSAAQETQVIKPELKRREVDIEKIDTEDYEVGIFAGLLSVEDFGVNLVVGGRFAYNISEDVFIEAAYAQSDTSKTSYERLSGGAQLLTPEERKLSYYNISIGYNVLPGEVFLGQNWAFSTAMYVIGGVGNTTFAGDDRFTMNIGAGMRFLASDWFAVHLDLRDHIFDIDLLGEAKTAHNLETHAGFTVFF